MEKPKRLKRIETEETYEVKDIVDLHKMPLETLEDYAAYNEQARRLKMPVKIPPDHLHPQWEVKFQRFDQPENILKYRLCNAEIDTRGQLIPGKKYVLPMPVVHWLNSLAVPQYGMVDVHEEGSPTIKETRQIGEKARFSCQFIREVA